MAELEIKDVQSGAVYRIAAQGSVIGREGAKADIIIKNPSVSKRHARIYADSGQWFLEDLGSSNGTFFANERIKEPVELAPGAMFLLAEIQFEVVKKPGEDKSRDRLRAATAARPDDGELLGEKGGPTGKPSLAKGGARNNSPIGKARADADEDVATGVPAILGALPRAFAHYMVAIPKLAFNPLGTIRKGIEEQPHPPMSGWSLAGWGLPPMILAGLIGVIGTVVATLVGGGSIGAVIVSALISPAIYAAVGVGFGVIWHPLVTFLIKLLKGESDATSRSNHFVMNMTAMALTFIASGVAVLVLLIPIPFIAVGPALLTMAASVISAFLGYSWLKFYNVHKIVQKIMLVLVVLSVVGGALGVVTAVTGGAATIAAGTTPSVPPTPDAPDTSPEASKEPATEVDPNKLADAKIAAQKAAADAAKVNPEAAKAQQDAMKEEAANKEKMKLELEKQAAEEARAKLEKAAADKEAAAKAGKTPEPSKTPEPARADPPAPSGGFMSWATKRDAVEKAIRDDPLLLRKGEILRLYENYSRVSFDVRKNYNAKRNKNEPWRDRIIDHQINGEIYEKTRAMIEDLYGKLDL